jgi:hypothetical protein
VNDLIAAWLRRQARCPEASQLVLRGSVVLGALCDGARAPVDVDYLAPGAFDARSAEKLACAIAAQPDEQPLYVARTLVIYGETRFPGLRVLVGPEPLQIDFGFGDPTADPPRSITVAGVALPACSAETLFAWKLHSLVEFGRGHWRAKHLYDLWLMWTRLPLDRELLVRTIGLAFSSRDTPLSMLDDFRNRADWGQSRGGARKWRNLKMTLAVDLLEARQTLRQALTSVLG